MQDSPIIAAEKARIKREVEKEMVQEQILVVLTTISEQLAEILEHLKSSESTSNTK
ncbi:MAG: hypothetical protein OXH39_19820 [Candidatus Poribacteria bacterium]|nr:hypothetical protein [Candidatus Poribacteria bacterium]